MAHALWFGPLLAVFGFLSYFTLFYRWPSLRDVPWLNLLILAAAVVMTLAATVQATGRRRILGCLGTAFSLFVTGLLCFYAFVFSYQLPAAANALDVGAPVPALTLRDHNGNDAELAATDRTLLVFYRGHW